MGGSSSSGDPAGPISLNGVDLNADVKKTVPDFEATKQRLQSVDFQSAIDSDSLFEDPHFPADRDSILDKRMSHEGLSKWESFVWKRPEEVYGEGNFCLYETIDEHDIH
jgi:hypothetical protein